MGNHIRITTYAVNAQSVGNSGNVDINIPNSLIVATPNKNNDISANIFKAM